jgi:RNA polymerase sigma-32 factor
MEKWFNNGEMSIDKEDDNESDGASPYNYIRAQSSHEPHRIVEKSQEEHNRSIRIMKALDALDERRQYIIKSRWLCEDGEEKSFKELSVELGVSIERVSQLEKDAMAKIKKALS